MLYIVHAVLIWCSLWPLDIVFSFWRMHMIAILSLLLKVIIYAFLLHLHKIMMSLLLSEHWILWLSMPKFANFGPSRFMPLWLAGVQEFLYTLWFFMLTLLTTCQFIWNFGSVYANPAACWFYMPQLTIVQIGVVVNFNLALIFFFLQVWARVVCFFVFRMVPLQQASLPLSGS